MDDLAALWSQITATTWIYTALVGTVCGVAAVFPAIRRAWLVRRRDRRLAQLDFIHRDELRELEEGIAEEPLRPSMAWLGAGGGALSAWIPMAAEDLGLISLYVALAASFVAVNVFYSLWRHLNDPPPEADKEPSELPSVTVPLEAKLGFAFAVCLVGALVLALVFLV
ncbi:hypothetical protein [Erythrobacter mangrovi]|uniref:Uncharacterized protein n=1 Tax=Erythrobacter mangrovi TaxID=2739433 RepID=A0A7D4CLJ2_9SPHN|nr:hypothetical protein [Erythrobacter mangrovi]QKG70668.1 hypothetical protein HQR01_04390 [Erythrobacter mangrovi]